MVNKWIFWDKNWGLKKNKFLEYLPFVSDRPIRVNIRRWSQMSHIRSISEYWELLLTCPGSTLEVTLFFARGLPEIFDEKREILLENIFMSSDIFWIKYVKARKSARIWLWGDFSLRHCSKPYLMLHAYDLFSGISKAVYDVRISFGQHFVLLKGLFYGGLDIKEFIRSGLIFN